MSDEASIECRGLVKRYGEALRAGSCGFLLKHAPPEELHGAARRRLIQGASLVNVSASRL